MAHSSWDTLYTRVQICAVRMELISPYFRVYVVMWLYITWKEQLWEIISISKYYNFKKRLDKEYVIISNEQ